MALQPSDYEQAARYLLHACEISEHDAFGRTTGLRGVLQATTYRLIPEAHQACNVAKEITALRDIARRVPVAAARIEILKAAEVLGDRN